MFDRLLSPPIVPHLSPPSVFFFIPGLSIVFAWARAILIMDLCVCRCVCLVSVCTRTCAGIPWVAAEVYPARFILGICVRVEFIM